MATLKAHSNGPFYSNMVIGPLAVDGWAVIFGTARMGLGGLCYQMYLHIIRCGLCTLKGKRLISAIVNTSDNYSIPIDRVSECSFLTAHQHKKAI